MTRSHYVINIAKKSGSGQFGDTYQHFGKVVIDDTREVARDRLAEFKRRFPDSDGFSVTMTYWKCVGESVE